jgi:pimeloyl-ACP methyl ester carboxylesterase
MITDFFITAADLHIHARSAGLGSRTIIFIHGNSCSADYWNDQLSDEGLQARYRLVSIDLPGHGSSDNTADYSIVSMTSILHQVIQSLNPADYIIAGLSYGTALIAETAPLLEKCKGYFMASPNVTNNEFPPTSYIIPFPELFAMVSETVPEKELRGFIARLNEGGSSPISEMFIQSYRKTDPRFRTQLGQAMGSGGWSDEFKNLLNTASPVCYVFGEEDKVLDIHYMDSIDRPANHSVQVLPGASHFVNNDQPAAFNDMLNEFVNNIFEG